MFKFILATFFLTTLVQAEFLEVGDSEFLETGKIANSRWHFDIILGGREFILDFPKFSGKHENLEEQRRVIPGISLGVGREFVFGGQYNLVTSFIGHYNRQQEAEKGVASEEADDTNLSELDTNYSSFAGELRVAIGYTFITSWIPVQIYLESGYGLGNNLFKKNYNFEGIASDPADNYEITIEELFSYTRFGAGVKFISSKGLYSFISGSLINQNTSESKRKGSFTEANQASTSIGRVTSDVSRDGLWMFNLGMGVYF